MWTSCVNHRNVLSVRSHSSTEFDKCTRRREHTRRVMYLLVTASAYFSFPKWLKSHLAKIFATNIDAHVSWRVVLLLWTDFDVGTSSFLTSLHLRFYTGVSAHTVWLQVIFLLFLVLFPIFVFHRSFSFIFNKANFNLLFCRESVQNLSKEKYTHAKPERIIWLKTLVYLQFSPFW